MSTVSQIPTPLDGEPVKVVEKTIKEVECPNPDCDYKLNITNINEGTKIKCGNCGNVTWVPSYKPKWWQRTKGFIGTIIVSFIIGLLTSLLASWIFANYSTSSEDDKNQHKTELNEGK